MSFLSFVLIASFATLAASAAFVLILWAISVMRPLAQGLLAIGEEVVDDIKWSWKRGYYTDALGIGAIAVGIVAAITAGGAAAVMMIAKLL